MDYYLDLKTVSLEKYKEQLKKRYLVKSRQLLRDNIEENFSKISVLGVNNLEELTKVLKTKNKLMDFASKTGVPVEYLTILDREIRSNKPKPMKLKDFPEVPDDIIENLEQKGIKTTVHLFPYIQTADDRMKLAKELSCDEKDIIRLSKLTNLCRVRWVNHTFAYVLYEMGYDTIDKLIKADYHKMHEEVNKINMEKQLYKGNIGLNDMKLLVEVAVDVPGEIEF